METKDIKRIQELVNEVNEIQGNCLKAEISEYEIIIKPTSGKTFHNTLIKNIIKYTEATENNWYISVDEGNLYLLCF